MNDLISRQAALDLARDICIPTKDGSIYRHRCIDPDAVRELLSAQPEQTKIIKEIQKWINSGNRGSADYFIVDKIEEIITNMNNDLISRQAAIDILDDFANDVLEVVGGRSYETARKKMCSLPSVQPDLDEWCTDCKEYDPKRHSCPRYTRVINEALKNARLKQKTGEWVPEFDGKFTGGAYWFSCSKCKRIVPEVRNGGWNFCPSCGADMRGEQDERLN